MNKKTKSPDLAERAFRRRRRQDAALVLPIFGVVMLISPVFKIFTNDRLIFGAPLPFIYIFVLWFFLIVLSRRITRLLTKEDEGG